MPESLVVASTHAKPKRLESAGTGRSGVHAVGLVMERELDWIFREQPDNDYGIDAHMEVVEDETVTGKLLALQLKSSKNQWKKRKQSDGWWFYPKASHVNYWLDHSLPVAVVLYDKHSNTAYWQAVNQKTLSKTKPRKKKNGVEEPKWRIFVPEAQVVGPESRETLARLAEGDPYMLRLRQLRLALPWMELLRAGRRILFDVEEAINKTSGRGSIMLRSVNDANEDSHDLGEWTVLLGLRSYRDVLPALVPWGEVGIHQETYDDAEYDQYYEECVTYDEEDKFFSMEFDEWRDLYRSDELRPFEESGGGEVARWRLEITLNNLGEAFLCIDEFAKGDSLFLHPPLHA
ncbi:DUF4365 domain-containing protein [Arthrobacter sp. GCM10027362]|uniref:DUF4365 domain-containing protein n=1 Tax=Arthrobacter sp. GCM10027362 TaxID=3273379 RepID=UPI00362C54EE